MSDRVRYLAKLSPQQIRQIHDYLLDERHIKQEWIAKQFDVKQSTISYHYQKIKNRTNEQNA